MIRKKRLGKLISAITATALIAGMFVFPSGKRGVSADGDSKVVELSGNGYSMTVTADKAEPAIGDTVTLTAVVNNGTEDITDLEAAGLYIYWWADSWNNESANTGYEFNNDGNSGRSLTASFVVDSAGTYSIGFNLQDSEWNSIIGNSFMEFEVTEAVEPTEAPVDAKSVTVEGNGYVMTVTADKADPAIGDTVTLTAVVNNGTEDITDLEAAGLYIYWWADNWNNESANTGYEFNNDGNSGRSLTASFVVDSAGIYSIGFNLQDNEWNSIIGNSFMEFEVTETVEPTEAPVDAKSVTVEGNGYSMTVTADKAEPAIGDTVTLTAVVNNGTEDITDLEAAGLYIYWWADNWNNESANTGYEFNNDGNSGRSLTASFVVDSAGIYSIGFNLQDNEWNSIIGNSFMEFEVTETVEPTEAPVVSPVEADINVDPVSGLADDFYLGVDISSVISEFDSGVKYYDYAGNEIDNVNDFVSFLASCGVNCIRVRVWNNPYDALGNGYGGGNNDVSKAKIIADACSAAGISMLVDFHCSDFWADPGKQTSPVAWQDMSLSERQTAIYDYVYASLNTIDPDGDTVAMVQIGNETTGAFAGVKSVSDMCSLFESGINAVNAYSTLIEKDVKTVIHITNPESGNLTKWAKNLSDYAVDYDIIATSYYPYWHGSLTNLSSEINKVRTTYGVDVMVAETSYAYTLADSDGHGNTTHDSVDAFANCTEPFSVQGQATSVRNLIATVSAAGGIGVFYWEPAWITVGDITGLSGQELSDQIASNKILWETYGSGWASSYSGNYDSDAAEWFGGSAVDNEAMFDASGHPLASLMVWSYVRSGAVSDINNLESVAEYSETIDVDGTYTLPDTVEVKYTKSTVDESVTWNADQIAAIDVSKVGVYKVEGTVALSVEVDSGETTATTTFTLTVKYPNILSDDVAGIEVNVFTVEGTGMSSLLYSDPQPLNMHDGTHCAHWYSATAGEGYLYYNETIDLEAGDYLWSCYAQGAIGDSVSMLVLDADGNIIYEGDAEALNDWKNWVTPSVEFTLESATSVKIAVKVNIADGGWGTFDSLYLCQTAAYTPEPTDTPVPTENPTPSQEISATPSAKPESTATPTPVKVATATPTAAVIKVTATATPTPVIINSDEEENVEVSAVEALVGRLYETVLGREADDYGLNYWCEKLLAGELNGRELVGGFVNSDEFKSLELTNEEYVGLLYNALMGRQADAEGMAYWLKALDAGKTRAEILSAFIDSDEWFEICSKAGIASGNSNGLDEITAFVRRLYDTCLDRPADIDGLNYWVRGLMNGNLTGRRCVMGFVFSNEFVSKNVSDEEYVNVMYRTFLGRSADPEGRAYWLAKLSSGVSRGDILLGFADSVEFGLICESCGIRS